MIEQTYGDLKLAIAAALYDSMKECVPEIADAVCREDFEIAFIKVSPDGSGGFTVSSYVNPKPPENLL